MFWWRNHRAPSNSASYHTGASSQRSRSVPRPVVLDLLALLSWCCRPSRWCFCTLAGAEMFPFTLGYSTPNPGSPLRVFVLVTRSSCSCGWWFLTHWRYPQSALGWWCLRQYALQRSLPTGNLPSFLPQGGSSSVESSTLLLKLEVFQKFTKIQNTTISNQCPLSSRDHRSIIH